MVLDMVNQGDVREDNTNPVVVPILQEMNKVPDTGTTSHMEDAPEVKRPYECRHIESGSDTPPAIMVE